VSDWEAKGASKWKHMSVRGEGGREGGREGVKGVTDHSGFFGVAQTP